MSNNRYLLEVGTEELPAGFLANAPTELENTVRQGLSEANIAFTDLRVLHTPRRLALVIDGLPEVQPDTQRVIKGPPIRVALDANGQPTPAGLGFAKKTGVDWQTLKTETLEGEAYWVLHQTVTGQSVQAVLAEKLPGWVLGLSGSHFMRWADWDVRFSRPIRWLVSLWNETHLPVTIGRVTSGRETWGHRVLGPGPFEVSSVAGYEALLRDQGKVIVDPEARKTRIVDALSAAGLSTFHNAQQNELLETVSLLVEHPSVFQGHFDPGYLSLPPTVIETVMSAHQKYFALPDASDATKLQAGFLVVSNGDPQAVETIRAGNERVLAARLADARFFFEDDQKRPLAERVEDLKGVTFQKGLGTMFDKAQRLVELIDVVAYALKLDEATVNHCRRAALLAKADLVTGMVRELTELQGEMGTVYAQLNGEAAEVSDALWSQYSLEAVLQHPSSVAQALYLADQLDTLVAVFAQKNPKLPTGSKDPIGLRRAANGILNLIIQRGLPVNLTALLHVAYGILHGAGLAGRTETDTWTDLYPFILQRLKSTLTEGESGIRPDVLEAVLHTQDPLTDLQDFMQRLGLVEALLKQSDRLAQLEAPANRISRILGDSFQMGATLDHVEEDFLKDPTEQGLKQAAQVLLGRFPLEKPLTEASYPEYAEALAAFAPSVDAFFEKVLVNDPDPQIKANRYFLLSVLNRLYLRIAVFSKLNLA